MRAKKKMLKNKNKLLYQRIKKVKASLKEKKLDALIISSLHNRYYLTGWLGDEDSGFVLVTPSDSYIITDSRYTEHAIKETTGFEIVETREGIGPSLKDIATKQKLKKVGYESRHISVHSLRRLEKYLVSTKLIATSFLIEELRSIKEPIELDFIKGAVNIAEGSFKHILGFIKVGMKEEEIAWELEKKMKENGAKALAWDPIIVATGANSSMVHWGASDSKVKEGNQVLLDYGCSYRGYVSDISRVIFVGEPTGEQEKIYNLVLDAQKLALNLVKAGKQAAIIDKKVRNFLEKHTKYYYRHALGHGVGLEVHELPYVNISRKNKLAVGNVITIEPGIYIPGWGGVRIEDMVLVTKGGYKLLTKAPKKIEDVTV